MSAEKRKEGNNLFSMLILGMIKSNGLKPKQRKFRLTIRKDFLTAMHGGKNFLGKKQKVHFCTLL